MSTFPQLEEALDAAAQRHYGRRRRRFSWRPLVPAVAVAAAAAAVLIARPDGVEPPVRERPAVTATVPEATLERSHALTLVATPEKPISRTPVTHAELPAVAAELRRSIPYPPGFEDDLDWAATPAGPSNMASINFREEVQMLLEYRAGCLWLQYWLSADAAGKAAAATVLADVPNWPYRRAAGDGSHWPDIATAAARGDATTLAQAERGDCAGM